MYTQSLVDIEKTEEQRGILREDLYQQYNRLNLNRVYKEFDIRDFLLRDVEQGRIKRKSDKYVKPHKWRYMFIYINYIIFYVED